jgi:hypothetical protein
MLINRVDGSITLLTVGTMCCMPSSCRHWHMIKNPHLVCV